MRLVLKRYPCTPIDLRLTGSKKAAVGLSRIDILQLAASNEMVLRIQALNN